MYVSLPTSLQIIKQALVWIWWTGSCREQEQSVLTWILTSYLLLSLSLLIFIYLFFNQSLSFGSVLCIPSFYLSFIKCQCPFTITGTVGKGPIHRHILPRMCSWPSNLGPLRTPLGKKKTWIQGKNCPRDTRGNRVQKIQRKWFPKGGL